MEVVRVAQLHREGLFVQICLHGDLTPSLSICGEEGIERRNLQIGGKKWKNPYFSNMQTRLFITAGFDTSLKSSKQQLGGKSVVGLAKQKSFLDAAAGRIRKSKDDEKNEKMHS